MYEVEDTLIVAPPAPMAIKRSVIVRSPQDARRVPPLRKKPFPGAPSALFAAALSAPAVDSHAVPPGLTVQWPLKPLGVEPVRTRPPLMTMPPVNVLFAFRLRKPVPSLIIPPFGITASIVAIGLACV